MKQTSKEGKRITGIENVWFLYLVLAFAILSILIVNFQVNIVWLRDFASGFRKSSTSHLYTQASHAANMMQEEAKFEIKNMENIAHDLAVIGPSSEAGEIFIHDFLKNNNNIREFSVVNIEGKETKRYSRSKSFGEADLRNFSNLEQFEKAKAGLVYASHIIYNEQSEPYIILSIPIKSLGYGEVNSVIMGQYFLRGMWEIALEMKIGESGRISVFDDKGMLVADPQPSRVLKKINLLNLSPVRSILSKKIPSKSEELSGYAFMNRSGINFGEGNAVNYLNEKNIEVLGIAIPMDIRGMRWGVLVEQNAAELQAPVMEVTRWLIIFLIGNLIAIGILIWIILIIRRSNQRLVSSHYFLETAKERAIDERNKTVSIISNFVDPVIVVDSSGRIVLINPAAKKVFGFSDTDLGKRIEDDRASRFSFESFRKILPIRFESKIIERDSNSFVALEEVIVGKKDPQSKLSESALTGSFRNELVYKVLSRPVCDSNKVCYGHMKIFYNLTREKMVDRMKSDFISIVAHQLRTPLSAIKWAIGMVMSGDSGEINSEQENFLRKGYESNQRMISLVNDLLNVSRIEEGRFGFSFSRVNFQDVFNNVISNLEGVIAAKHIKVNLEKEGEMPEVFMDKDKIELAFQNILDNAVKYTPNFGEIQITVRNVGGYFEVRIKDNGIGIPKGDQTRLFSKFFRSANVVKMQTEGSGLGLFIVKNIIENHGGKIDIKSEEGKGTEVVFSIPLERLPIQI